MKMTMSLIRIASDRLLNFAVPQKTAKGFAVLHRFIELVRWLNYMRSVLYMCMQRSYRANKKRRMSAEEAMRSCT